VTLTPRPLVGLIVPSSNPTVERVALRSGILDLIGIDIVVTRIEVRTISTASASDAQFSAACFNAAAALLADSRPDLITWAGTSGFWRGAEERDMAAITAATGIAASDSRQAVLAALHDIEAGPVAVLTPYTDAIGAAVEATLTRAGHPVGAARHLGHKDNLTFSRIPPATLQAAAAELGQTGRVPVVAVCTNLVVAAPGTLVVDSVLATLWDAARRVGATTIGYREIHDALVPTLATGTGQGPVMGQPERSLTAGVAHAPTFDVDRAS
jgi:maleate isomerase